MGLPGGSRIRQKFNDFWRLYDPDKVLKVLSMKELR